MTENRTVIAVAVVSDGERFLVGERPPGVALAGYAEFPGGKLLPGELPAAAAKRECLEETGVHVEIDHLWTQVDFDYPHGQLRLQFFACRPQAPVPPPIPPFRWVSRQEFAELKFPPANERLLRLLLRP